MCGAHSGGPVPATLEHQNLGLRPKPPALGLTGSPKGWGYRLCAFSQAHAAGAEGELMARPGLGNNEMESYLLPLPFCISVSATKSECLGAGLSLHVLAH